MKTYNLPIIIEKDENGFYVAECPIFKGCYTQADTKKEVLKNIREVIEICLKEHNDNKLTDISSNKYSLETLKMTHA